MGTNRRARFRPRHDILEERCLLSQAVIDIPNNSLQAVVNHHPGAELSFASHSSPSPSPSPSATSSPTPTPTPTPAPNPVYSTNWSGYAAAPISSSPQPGSVTDVSANWTVPTVTGSHKQTAYSAVWVGIDGYLPSSQTVEQVGTAQDIINGRASYYAWWEMWSSVDNMPEQQITSMTIQPGDSISASVEYITSGPSAGDFALAIIDNSHPNDLEGGYVNPVGNQSPLPTETSAEWIVEAPSGSGGILPLANFGSVTFTNAQATINGVTGPINDPSWKYQAIDMINNSGTLLATTSTLQSNGTSFVVTDDSTSGGSSGPGPKTHAGLAAPPPGSFMTVTVQAPQVLALGVIPVTPAQHAGSGPFSDANGS